MRFTSLPVGLTIAPADLGMVRVEGWVVDIASPSERGERLLIAPVRIGRLAPDDTPTRIRVVLADGGGPGEAPPPGTPISIMALIDPPPGPGAYDFARDAWFEGIGAVGMALRPPLYAFLPRPPPALRLEMAVDAFRWKVAGKLVADIAAVMGKDDGGAAGLAEAVTTSHQG